MVWVGAGTESCKLLKDFDLHLKRKRKLVKCLSRRDVIGSLWLYHNEYIILLPWTGMCLWSYVSKISFFQEEMEKEVPWETLSRDGTYLPQGWTHQPTCHPSKYMKSESEVTQSCLTLCDPMDYSLPGYPIHGIFQTRVLEWVAISFCQVKRHGRKTKLD